MFKQVSNSVKTGIFIGIAATSVVALTGCGAAGDSGSGGGMNTIAVSGMGTASGTPDIAYVQVGVHTSGPRVGEAVEDNNAIMQAAMEALNEAGIDAADMQTSFFNVWSEERYNEASIESLPIEGAAASTVPQTSVIYHVENTLSLTIRDVSRVSEVLQAALDAGANRVNSVSFGIEDPSALETEARAAALENARARADSLADNLGVAVGPVVSVNEGVAGGVFPQAASAEMARGLGGGGGLVPISEGEFAVSVQVLVAYQLR